MLNRNPRLGNHEDPSYIITNSSTVDIIIIKIYLKNSVIHLELEKKMFIGSLKMFNITYSTLKICEYYSKIHFSLLVSGMVPLFTIAFLQKY